MLVKVGFSVTHHDHEYVERRGGWELLTHLRGAPARVDYRREAIERALRRYGAAADAGSPGPEVGGLGLIVLQRALLAAEDLGGLLHAFAGPHPWDRLRATKIPDLDEAFASVLTDLASALHESFRVPTDEHIDGEHMDSAERLAFTRLRGRVADRWAAMLQRSARLWLEQRHVAKATMHGFPLLAGEHVIGPPGAGELGAGLRPPAGLFAVAVTSQERGRHITTDRHVVALDAATVRRYARDGRCAARLTGELCQFHAASIMDGCAAVLPTDLIRHLDSSDRERIGALGARRAQERDARHGA